MYYMYQFINMTFCLNVITRYTEDFNVQGVNVCVCVCMCVSKRERERKVRKHCLCLQIQEEGAEGKEITCLEASCDQHVLMAIYVLCIS